MSATARRVRAIVALDTPELSRAAALVDTLGNTCDFYKVGSELFTSAGPEAVAALRLRGADVFLDLKFHDIPNTVRGAARSASLMGATLLTAHATGGGDMLRAAVEGAGTSCGVLAVTVLTSLSAEAVAESWGRSVERMEDEVMRLAEIARSAGAQGIVCAAREARAVRAAHGDALRVLVPGIRLEGGASHDQSRVATPADAAAAGASYIVVGRAVTTANDPRGVMLTLMEMLA
ncbi:MAG: orotidine-5'-phosphate decarboxylase [Gemmatimonadaceae bacterium]